MFTGFIDRHFDAYQQTKWRSKAFSLERMAVKDTLVELGRELSGHLAATDGTPLAWEVSVEHPTLSNQRQVDAQHLYFVRSPEARHELDRIIDRSRGMASLLEDPSPQRSHVILNVGIWLDHVFVGLMLHRDADIDRRNLEQQLEDPEHAQTLAELLGALPDALQLSVDEDGIPARQCSIQELRQRLASLTAPPGKPRWLTIGQYIDRTTAVALGRTIHDAIAGSLRALLPLYQRITWTRDNDHIAMREQLDEPISARPVRPTAPMPAAHVPDRVEAAHEPIGSDVSLDLSKNDQVRITSGVFAGRSGVIQEIDSKGLLKVLVGNIPIKLRTDEVERR